MQDSSILLLTHAQITVAVAGFASVAAAIRRPLTPILRQRFLALLSVSVLQVLACLFPVWLATAIPESERTWQMCSILMLALYGGHTWWLVLVPIRKIGKAIGTVINPAVTAGTWIASAVAFLTIAVNALGYPVKSSFHVYYAGNAIWLFIGFMIFAEVATSSAEDTESDA